jgi:HEAT repeat protein
MSRINSLRILLCGIAIVVAAPADHPAAAAGAADREQQLLEVLRSAEPAEKAMACKQLAIHGAKASVPELAKLLADEHLASWARIALEAITDPAADAALVEASVALDGRLLVGVINSIGVRRSPHAVDALATRLTSDDQEVAAAAAVALGRIGDDAAATLLRGELVASKPSLRAAAAEGCILCAERLVADGKLAEAAELFDEIREADVPRQRILEATRGAILARKPDGLPLLLEQLRSPDQNFFYLGLSVAREFPGDDWGAAVASELPKLPPNRAVPLLYALGDCPEAVVSPAILAAAASGDKAVRLAALDVVGHIGDAENVPLLLSIAADADPELAEGAKQALVTLPGQQVDESITARIGDAAGGSLATLIELVGLRRIENTAALVSALDHAEPEVRNAALGSLGATIGPEDLDVLLERFLNAKHADEAEASDRALRTALMRMPDRAATARALGAAARNASTENQARLIAMLGVVGGAHAAATIDEILQHGDAQLYDAATRALGEWMSADAAPLLLRLATSPENKSYQGRALRGYLRLARQFAASEAERAEMCRQALTAAARPDDQKLVLAVLDRSPSLEGLAVAVESAWAPELQAEAAAVAHRIASELGEDRADVQELLKTIETK